jgi:hypothetical protein
MGPKKTYCVNCPDFDQQGSEFIDLLSSQYKDAIDQWHLSISDRRFLVNIDSEAITKAANSGTRWLAKALGISPGKLSPPAKPAPSLQRFLFCLDQLLQNSLYSAKEKRELCSILSSELMAVGYRQHVADPAVASMEAVNYEKYEDIVLRKIMNAVLSTEDSVAMVELGSGVGRVIHQYGSCISSDPKACVRYRRLGPELYRQKSLDNPERLKLILGIDFSVDMLQKSVSWLKQDRLGELVREGRIVQVLGSIRSLKLDFGAAGLSNLRRVVCILFQTIGNQIGLDLQVEMLSKAKEIAGTNGVVIVSAFNGESFAEQGREYYRSIGGSVGKPWAWGDNFFLSDKGVYSYWLSKTELSKIFSLAGMSSAEIFTHNELKTFPDFDRYIDLENQEQYKRRCMIGMYAPAGQTLLAQEIVGQIADGGDG